MYVPLDHLQIKLKIFYVKKQGVTEDLFTPQYFLGSSPQTRCLCHFLILGLSALLNSLWSLSLYSCAHQSSWMITQDTVVGRGLWLVSYQPYVGHNEAFHSSAVRVNGHVACAGQRCWPASCPATGGRVTGQLKPLIYYSSARVRNYRGSRLMMRRGREEGEECTAEAP